MECFWKPAESECKLQDPQTSPLQYWQKPNKSLDNFLTRARTLTQMCDFTDEELSERHIELIIFLTPYDAFCNELYNKSRG